MSYGMTYEQFWDGDVDMHREFRRAHKLRISEANTMAWLQGRYFYDALCAVSPIIRAFSKARKPSEYHKKPFDIFEEERRRSEEKEARERQERIRIGMESLAERMKRHENSERKEVDADGRDGRTVVQTGSDHD